MHVCGDVGEICAAVIWSWLGARQGLGSNAGPNQPITHCCDLLLAPEFLLSAMISPARIGVTKWLFCLLGLTAGVPALLTEGTSKKMVFDQPISSHEWTLMEIDPGLPADWTGYEFLVLEFRASSTQRFELGLRTAEGIISKRIHPYAGVWVRASIPLRFYRQGLGDGVDLAATVNQPRNSYWINIEAGGHGPTTDVKGIGVVMRYPNGSPTLELRSVTLAKTDPGDAVLDGKPLIDEFGQYIHADWPGRASSEADLQKAWTTEADTLAAGAPADRDRFGGFAATTAKVTGFFRVEQIDGRWWFVTPDGHFFFSTGVNGIITGSGTRTAGREDFFAKIPPPMQIPPGMPMPNRLGPLASFYTENLKRRYGENFQASWAALTARRLAAWDLNTAYGPALNDALAGAAQKRAYVLTLRGWQVGQSIMGMPDVYSDEFAQRVEAEASRQLTPRKDDPWLLGYFIGNEPPWPGRESQLVNLILAGPPSKMQERFKAGLATGDTPERRRDLMLAAFEHYLAVINTAVKKYDPHHLNLGIRFGGDPPDYVVKLARGFDVYSLNKYRYAPPAALLDRVYRLTGLPVLIGEFHIGVPNRGMAPGLVQAMNQEERGVAYRYYVEHAAAFPQVVGTHWFQWIDQPATGRPDGENYNIGWVDVTDRPYPELVAAAQLTHARLLAVHSGQAAPFDRKPRAADIGSPEEATGLGIPAIQ